MNHQLKVSLENIIPLTYARDHFSQIVAEVQRDKLFVLTKGGVPAVAIIDVKYLESITGGQIQKKEIQEEIKKAPEKVGLPSMVEHKTPTSPMPPSPPSPAPPLKPTPPAPQKSLPPKPAGFAAPSFSKASTSADAMADRSQPKPQLPKPDTGQEKPLTPPAKEVKPAPAPPLSQESKPTPPPPAIKTETKPKLPTPSTPLKTPPLEEEKIDVEFAPDQETLDEKAQDAKRPEKKLSAPDDLKPPAQYSGENKDEAVEDMALD